MSSAPKISPLILAALPIPNNLDAPHLFDYLNQILHGLIDHDIYVISYACDGSVVERSVQSLLVESGNERIEYSIPNPQSGERDIIITVIKIRGQPLTIVQDSKHALKTYRNNLFSGARCLVMGNYVALYEQVLQLSRGEGTPLYQRDVNKVDRQDDNAATRLFSAGVLQYLSDHHPEYTGLFVYLFVFGELVDAYQNRHIPHAERQKLVLRARYFLDYWLAFLAAGQYPTAQYCLSREALDITRILIEGYISLMYIHRDCLSDRFEEPVPFLPWLHSSEPCEHVFGDARRIVSDFTMLDFIYFVPKLSVTLRKAANQVKDSDAKATAMGYNHTYLNCDGMDLLALATFPNDSEIGEIAQVAAEEADSLINLLGIDPARLRHLKRLGLQTTVLPSIDTWLPVKELDELAAAEDLEDNIESSEQEVLQKILEQETNPTLSRTHKQDETVERLSYAAAVLIAEDMVKV